MCSGPQLVPNFKDDPISKFWPHSGDLPDLCAVFLGEGVAQLVGCENCQRRQGDARSHSGDGADHGEHVFLVTRREAEQSDRIFLDIHDDVERDLIATDQAVRRWWSDLDGPSNSTVDHSDFIQADVLNRSSQQCDHRYSSSLRTSVPS